MITEVFAIGTIAYFGMRSWRHRLNPENWEVLPVKDLAELRERISGVRANYRGDSLRECAQHSALEWVLKTFHDLDGLRECILASRDNRKDLSPWGCAEVSALEWVLEQIDGKFKR